MPGALAPEGRVATLLFVEDDPDACEIFQALFEGRHRVLIASETQGALARARADAPDLIFLDLGLQGAMEGLNLLRRLKDDPATSSIPAAVMTGRPGVEDEVRRAGAAAFLLKPVAVEDLERAVETLLKARR